MNRSNRLKSISLFATLVTLSAAMLAGCGAFGNGQSPSPSSEPTVNTGLETFASQGSGETDAQGQLDREELRRRIEQQAESLPSLTEGRVPQPPVVSDGPPPKTNFAPTIEIDSPGDADPALEAATKQSDENADRATNGIESEDDAEKSAMTAEPAGGDERRRDRLISELVSSLQQEVDRRELPLREYTALAALEMLRPGVSPDPASIPSLTPREQELLAAWRDLFRQGRDGLASAGGGLGALTDAVTELAQRMQQWETLEITTAHLCSKVEGFGQYTTIKPTFLANRRNRAIVYIEVENYTHQAATGPGGAPGYVVELTEELSLYHDADGLLAWRKPRQEVRDFSRNRRRDFFIVQMIELPETLTVGEYRLKITIQDAPTGAIAEAVIPIEVVADAALVRGEE